MATTLTVAERDPALRQPRAQKTARPLELALPSRGCKYVTDAVSKNPEREPRFGPLPRSLVPAGEASLTVLFQAQDRLLSIGDATPSTHHRSRPAWGPPSRRAYSSTSIPVHIRPLSLHSCPPPRDVFIDQIDASLLRTSLRIPARRSWAPSSNIAASQSPTPPFPALHGSIVGGHGPAAALGLSTPLRLRPAARSARPAFLVLTTVPRLAGPCLEAALAGAFCP